MMSAIELSTLKHYITRKQPKKNLTKVLTNRCRVYILVIVRAMRVRMLHCELKWEVAGKS